MVREEEEEEENNVGVIQNRWVLLTPSKNKSLAHVIVLIRRTE